MRWNYDSYGIGLTRKGQQGLVTRQIQRPRGITQMAWVEHAQEVCRVLNKEH